MWGHHDVIRELSCCGACSGVWRPRAARLWGVLRSTQPLPAWCFSAGSTAWCVACHPRALEYKQVSSGLPPPPRAGASPQENCVQGVRPAAGAERKCGCGTARCGPWWCWGRSRGRAAQRRWYRTHAWRVQERSQVWRCTRRVQTGRPPAEVCCKRTAGDPPPRGGSEAGKQREAGGDPAEPRQRCCSCAGWRPSRLGSREIRQCSSKPVHRQRAR